MEFENGKLFEHCFFVKEISFENKRNIIEWCNQNCSGQWLIIRPESGDYSDLKLTFYTKPITASLYSDKQYPPSTISVTLEEIISFELDEDAVAFKLKWF